MRNLAGVSCSGGVCIVSLPECCPQGLRLQVLQRHCLKVRLPAKCALGEEGLRAGRLPELTAMAVATLTGLVALPALA